MRSKPAFIIGNNINVVPIWNNSGLISNKDKLIPTFNKIITKNDKLKTIVNDNHDCWLLSFNLNIDKFSVSNFINKKKIDDIPKLMLVIISFNIPKKNIKILDGFKFNFLMHK